MLVQELEDFTGAWSPGEYVIKCDRENKEALKRPSLPVGRDGVKQLGSRATKGQQNVKIWVYHLEFYLAAYN